MKKLPKISDAEWEVMNVIWGKSPITANEVVDALAAKTAWNPKTIKTMLNRLVKKGALTFDQEVKTYLYKPLVKRTECIHEEGRSFVDRVFGGQAASMLVHFMKDTKLSPDEIEELKKIIAQKGE